MEKQQTQEVILETALKIFIQKGYDGARMQEIATKAGINKALLHYYYRNKQQLFTQVFKMLLGRFVRGIFGSIGPVSPFFAFIERFIKGYLMVVYPHRQALHFIVWEAQRNSEAFANAMRQEMHIEKGEDVPLVTAIKKAIETKEIIAADPYQIAVSIMGLCVFPYMATPLLKQIVPELDVDDPNFATERAKFLVEFVRQGLAPKGE